MTSLLPLLPDSPRPPASDALTGGPATLPSPGAGASEFAGLVEAFAAPASPTPTAATGLTPLAEGIDADAARAPDPEAAQLPPAATALATWPTGKTLPEPGALLPPALPPEVPSEPPANAVPTSVPTASPAAALPPFPQPAAQPIAPTPDAGNQEGQGLGPDTILAHAALLPRAAAPARAARADVAEQADPPASEPAAFLAKSALSRPPLEDFAQAQPGDEQLPDDLGDTASIATVLPDGLAQPAILAAALAPPPLASAAPTPAPVSAGLELTPSRAAATSRSPATARVGAQGDIAATPAPRAVPPSLALPGAATGSGDVVPAPALGAEAGPAFASDAGALPDSEAPAPAAPATGTPAANIAANPPLPERSADPRSIAPAPAAPQLESAIAQVGDIREALRSARPAMTLQHAEFGAVAIRLEPAAPEQWRAVLASRDPGFVPAIQAALETRAVAASADTSSNFSGHSGTHQNGTSDQRYGSSPNGGQGSPQPYLGQSGQRDGEAAPDHRRPSTAAALAARGGSEAEDAAASTPGSGGLFA